MKRAVLAVLLMLAAFPVTAQTIFTEYRWEQADFTLRIPASWDMPLAESSDDRSLETLFLFQDFAESPDTRPPAVPFMTLRLYRDPLETLTPYEQLVLLLDEIGIQSVGSLPFVTAGKSVEGTIGSSADSTLYGTGRILPLDGGGTLIITGRASALQQDSFTAIFNAVANSLVQGSNQLTAHPQSGVLWQTIRDAAYAEEALLDPIAIAFAPESTIYVVDRYSGIMALNAVNGEITWTLPVSPPFEPASLAVAPDGTLYLADLACSCIRRFSAETELEPIIGFGVNAPLSIAIQHDGTLYATDDQDGSINLIVLSPAGDQTIALSDPFSEQPVLTTNRLGEVLALARDGSVYKLEGTQFEPLMTINLSNPDLIAAAVDNNNNLVVVTQNQGVFIVGAAGEIITSVGQYAPVSAAPDEISTPKSVTSSPDGVIYIAEGDGFSGEITAFSLAVEPGRIGTTHLLPGSEVQGVFETSAELNRHLWTFEAQQGDIVTLTALADFEAPLLDLALRLLAPDGSEIALADQDETGSMLNPYDPQLKSVTVTEAGLYIVIVEQLAGEGRYRLGFTRSQSFSLAEEPVYLTGSLRASQPLQSWLFEGQAGQTLTFTMQSQSGSLDPMLVLWNATGELVAENDDALDLVLGRNAQIVAVRLDRSGIYRLDAGRFDGEGSYQLEINEDSD